MTHPVRIQRRAPICCGAFARLTSGAEIYPHRPDLHGNPIYVCDACRSRVGCHPGTITPLGTPATAETRGLRRRLHDLRLDPIWKRAPDGQRAAYRRMAYAVLADRLGIEPKEVHVGHFDADRCRAAWTALAGVTVDNIKEIYDAINARR